jgi:hypothetical protein
MAYNESRKVSILKPLRLFEAHVPALGKAFNLSCDGIDWKCHSVFLREEKTSVGRCLCVVFRISKRDWERAGWHDIVELVWVPVKDRVTRRAGMVTETRGLVRFCPAFLRKNDEQEVPHSASQIKNFVPSRPLPDSTNLVLTAHLLFQWIEGTCFCCGHVVHPPLPGQKQVLAYLAPLVEANRTRQCHSSSI